MIGKHTITLGAEDFIRGMSTSPDIRDGGFSDESDAVNPKVRPGLLYGPADTVDSDTDSVLNTNAEIIASCPDAQLSSPNERLCIAHDRDNGDGELIRFNGTKLVAVTGGLDTTQNYGKGFTDIIPYKGRAYFTSKEELGEWQTAGDTIDFSFFTFANSAVPHPALVFENNAYYGDGNLLLRQTSAGGTPATILTLDATQIIVALGIDHGTGKMLISTISNQNISGTIPTVNKILWYDGFSNKVSKTIIVEEMVTAFHSHQGRNIVGYGRNIGLLSGSGVKFLRKLQYVTFDSNDLPYKHNFASIEDTLYIVDQDHILAYGPVLSRGSSVFYYLYDNDITASADFRCIFNAGQGDLGLSTTANKFHTLTTDSISNTSNGIKLKSNWYQFPRPVIMRDAYIEFAGSTNTGNVSFNYEFNDGAGVRALQEEKLASFTLAFQVGLLGFLPTETNSIKFQILISSANSGLRKFIASYDFVE